MLSLIIHNVRSVYNVGAMLRTAEGAGVDHVYLSGITPDPVDRFGRLRPDLAKVALGAERTVRWSHVDDITTLIRTLQAQGTRVIAVEQHTRSRPYTSFVPSGKVALIVGPEVEGLSDELVLQCDEMLEIPMYGAKESLNVSVAAGIMLYHCRHAQNEQASSVLR